MASIFKDGPGKAYRGEVQKVLQTLRWDPIDGHFLALTAPAVTTSISADQDGHSTPAGDSATATWRFGLGPEVAGWLKKRDLDHNLRDQRGMARPGLSILELCSCIALDPGSGQGARDTLAALEAQRARGKLAIYAGSARFFWRRSYHLALPDAIGLGGSAGPDGGWHAEGGQYQASAPIFGAPVWRRRPPRSPAGASGDPVSGGSETGLENARPADSFDPRPAYLFAGLEAECADPPESNSQHTGVEHGGRFQPFVLRVGGLETWPPHPLLRDTGEAGQAGRPALSEQSRLAAWYRPCPGTLTMRWAVSPRLSV